MTPDVNVLVAAFRRDHLHHRRARDWLAAARDACQHGRESLTLLPMVMSAFLRLVASRKIFIDADTVGDAIGFLDNLLTTTGIEIGSVGSEWPLLRRTLLDRSLVGNDVSDAGIASAVQEKGEHLVTFDRNFLKLLPARDVTVLDPDWLFELPLPSA